VALTFSAGGCFDNRQDRNYWNRDPGHYARNVSNSERCGPRGGKVTWNRRGFDESKARQSFSDFMVFTRVPVKPHCEQAVGPSLGRHRLHDCGRSFPIRRSVSQSFITLDAGDLNEFSRHTLARPGGFNPSFKVGYETIVQWAGTFVVVISIRIAILSALAKSATSPGCGGRFVIICQPSGGVIAQL